MFQYVPANTRPHYQMPGRQVTFLITNDDTGGHSCTVEMLYEPGAGTGLHTHHDNDEQVYVLNGEGRCSSIEKRSTPPPGTSCSSRAGSSTPSRATRARPA